MKIDGIERALRLLDEGRITDEPLSKADADEILESRISIEDLILGGSASAAALHLFAEVRLAKLGAKVAPSDLRAMLEHVRREERDAALSRVAQEPIELWTPSMIRRAQQILGGSLLEIARESYIEALRAGLPAADAIAKRFTDLTDDIGILRAKHDGVEVATSGRASSKRLAFLFARFVDGTMDPTRFYAWAREQYLIAMYGRSVRTNLAVALAAHVELDSVTEEEIERGRALDLVIDPKEIEAHDLPLIDLAVLEGAITQVERDEALRVAMFHQFERGAAVS